MSNANEPRLIQLGAALRSARKAKKLSQEALSEKVGLNLNHLGSIERGETNTTVLSLFRICEELEISCAAVIGAIEGDFSEKRALLAKLDGYLATRPLEHVGFVFEFAKHLDVMLGATRLSLRREDRAAHGSET